MKILRLASLSFLLLPGLVFAQPQTPPVDTLGLAAWEKMQNATALNVPGPDNTSWTVTFPVEKSAWGKFEFAYGASKKNPELVLHSYTWKYQDQTDADVAKAFGADASHNPDPNPPKSNTGSVGDTQTSHFQLGSWAYAVTYSYENRNDVLGWHVDSFDVSYKQ